MNPGLPAEELNQRHSRNVGAALLAAIALCAMALSGAQAAEPRPVTLPKLELVYTAVVGIAPIEHVGETRDGMQRIIPITGGTFEGPAIRGTVAAGAADGISRAMTARRSWRPTISCAHRMAWSSR